MQHATYPKERPTLQAIVCLLNCPVCAGFAHRNAVLQSKGVPGKVMILAHNHPSGVAEPSIQDQALTRTLSEVLALIDVKVLDHFIVAGSAALSFAERGLL